MRVCNQAVKTRRTPSRLSSETGFHSTLLMVAIATGLISSPPRDASARTQPSVVEGKGGAARQSVPEYVPDEILVRFREGVSEPLAKGVHARIGARALRSFRAVEGLQVVKLPPGVAVKEAIRAYRQDPDVIYAEPNYIYHVFANPNDPRYAAEQWNLHTPVPFGGLPGGGIDAARAWDITNGSSQVVVAVIDSGIDYRHPDLAANMFRNAADCDTDNVDDDGNGYTDDCYGIDTFNNDSDPFDDLFHGTAVAGVIGAVGNNGMGITGVNWNVGLMPCKWLGSGGYGELSGALECFDYVAAMKDRGVNIVATNNSWGGTENSQALFDAILEHSQRGILCVAAAGNEFLSIDDYPQYPASYFLANVIAVGANDSQGGITIFSNFGPRTVHLRAPGQDVLTTFPQGAYNLVTGTYISAPHVSGVAALLQAENPTQDWKAIKNLILAGGDPVSNADWVITGKKLNAYGSMHCADKTIYKRLRPFTDSSYSKALQTGYVGIPYEFFSLHINCDQPAGDWPVQVTDTSETFSLLDDGVSSDQVAGDGIYSAGWMPPAGGEFRLLVGSLSSSWENVFILVLDKYQFSETSLNYRDINGTSLDLGSGGTARIPLTFSLPFGGLAFNDVFVGENGVISISSPFNAALNQSIPDGAANMLIAPFWDDLQPVPGTTQNIYYEELTTDTGRELVVEWRNLRHANCPADSAATVKFQVVLFDNKQEILFNYADTAFGAGCAFADHGATATVGIQVGPKAGTQYSFETASLSDNTAVLWKLPNASQVQPSSLTYFDTRVGTTGDSQYVQVTNPSTVPVNILSVTSTGDFSTWYYCPGPILRGNPCWISVTFSPTATGPRTGTLTITTDSPQSPHAIPLTGNGYEGQGPVLSLSVTSLDFGEQLAETVSPPKTVNLTNTGDAGMGIRSIDVWDQTYFPMAHDCGPLPKQLEVGQSCAIQVSFQALGAPRPVQGYISGYTTASAVNFYVALTGTVIAPLPKISTSELIFPDQPVGMVSAPQSVTLSNEGTAPLSISNISTTGEFEYSTSCGESVAAGAACTIETRFKPMGLGFRHGTLKITPGSSVYIPTVFLRGNTIPAFALSTAASAQVVTRGSSSATFSIQVTSPYGYIQSVALACTNASNAQCEFNPPAVQPGQTATLTVSSLAAVSQNSLDFIVVGSGPEGNHSVSLPLQINFAEVLWTTSPPSATVAAGAEASYELTLTPTYGFNQTIAFSCTQLPKETTCAFDPPTATPDGTNPITVKAKIRTMARSMTLPPISPPFLPPGATYSILALAAGLALLAMKVRRGPSRVALGANLLLIVAMWAACGGGGGAPPAPQRGTPAGTYFVTIHATAGSLDRSTQVTLKVN